jgi:putative tricarboxylic transport membrane protein
VEFLSNVADGFATAATLENLVLVTLGVLLGTVIGMLPGLGSATGVAIVLPVTLTLNPVGGLIMLAGIYYGSQYGATISAVLIATPGDSASVVTMFDGYPMARAGRAGQALAAAAISSFIAGTISVAFLMAAAPSFGAIALRFGAPENFALMVLGILSVAGFTSSNVFKGLAMGALGLVIGTIGIDAQTGVARMTFGEISLFGGVGFIEFVMCLFAIAEVMRQVGRGGAHPIRTRFRDMLLTRQDLGKTVKPSLRGGVLGFVLGVLPGAGATLAAFFSYEVERRISKTPERFGRGELAGITGPEGANNAAVNGSFVPTLRRAIPGTGTTAVLLGAFLFFGLQPGPLLMVEQSDLVWGLMASFWIGNLLLLVLNLPLAPVWARLLRIPRPQLYAGILFFACLGAYATNLDPFDIGLLLVFGLLGMAMRRFGLPVLPLILGVILGDQIEINLVRSIMTDSDPRLFVTRPISGFLLAASVLSILGALWQHRRMRRRGAAAGAEEEFYPLYP